MSILDDFLPRRFAEERALNRLRKALKHARAIHDQVKSLRQYVRKYRIEPGTGYHKFNPITQAKQAIQAIGLPYAAPPEPIKKDRRAFLIVKRTDGWYVAEKAGPFKTREAARTARETLKNNQ
jgi:hypothetical protein